MELLHRLCRKVSLFWRLAGPGLLVGLAIAVLVQGRNDGRLHLYFLAAGQGNAVLVVSPAGRTVLVDGGPEPSTVLSELGRHLPFWKRELDVVVLTETAPEQMAGPVAVLERYRAGAAFHPPRVRPGVGWERWRELLRRAGTVPLPLSGGVRLELGDGVTIEVLYPGEKPLAGINEAGRDDALVLRICYGQFCALVPTEAGPKVQRFLLESGVSLGSSVLLVPRQAGEKALEADFLQAVGPRLAVVSAGTGYQQGPDARTMEAVREVGIPLYRTDREGTIEVVTEGRTISVHYSLLGLPLTRLGCLSLLCRRFRRSRRLLSTPLDRLGLLGLDLPFLRPRRHLLPLRSLGRKLNL